MARGNTFKPLTLELVEEGNFLKDADEALHKAQVKLVQHVLDHGLRSKKGKAEIKMTISLEITDVDDEGSEPEGMYAITTKIDTKLPGRPSRVTGSFAQEDDNGDLVLFVRDTGSTAGNPRQMKLDLTTGPIDVSIDTSEEK